MEFKDYYQILGVEEEATSQDIKRAHRKLARKYHPDVSELPDAEERFKEIQEAYEVLKDPEKRAAYDQFGAGYEPGQPFTAPDDWEQAFGFQGGGYTQADAAHFSEFFSSLFGSRGGSSHHRDPFSGRTYRGQDINASLTVSIMDSYQGSQQRLTLPAADGSAPRQITVTIPKGIQAGQHLRLAGQGMPGPNGGAAGDLLIAIAFSAHPYYHAEGKHVHLALPVAPWEAALGAKVSVPTPTGTITLTIPKHAAQGKKLRLKGKGLPAAEPGDLFVTLNIVLPEAHDETVVAAYDAFQQATDFDPRHHLFKEAL